MKIDTGALKVVGTNKNIEHISQFRTNEQLADSLTKKGASAIQLKITSATKWQLLKMCHLRQKLRIFLFHRKIMFHSQDIQVFVFLTSPWFTKSVTSRWVLVHETRYVFEYIFWTTTHEVTILRQLIDISNVNNSK